MTVTDDGPVAVCSPPDEGISPEFIGAPLGREWVELDRRDQQIKRLRPLGTTIAWEEELRARSRRTIAMSCRRARSATTSASVRGGPLHEFDPVVTGRPVWLRSSA